MKSVNADATNHKSSIVAEIDAVGRELAISFGPLLTHLQGGVQTASHLAESLKVDKALAIRLLAAVRKKDPLATAHVIPGPDPLSRVIKAASRKGVPDEVLRPTMKAVSAFRKLIQVHGGDRSGLDAIIAASLPDTRVKYETVAKQSMYRGARQIKGISVDTVVYTIFLHPCGDRARLDCVQVLSYLGMRRVRPGARLKLCTRSQISVVFPGQDIPRTLDGEPVEHLTGVLLPAFCSGAAAEFEVCRQGGEAIYIVDWGEAVGWSSARDVVTAEIRRSSVRRYRTADDLRTKSGFVFPMRVPTQVYICDLILHEDVYPGVEPKVRVLELGEDGYAEVNDESRELDVLDVLERVEPLGNGVDTFRIAEMPNYIELLQHTCGKFDWDPRRFRGYRTRIEYPIFGSQVQFAFEVPVQVSGLAQVTDFASKYRPDDSASGG